MAPELKRAEKVTIQSGDDPRAAYTNVCSVSITPEELFLHFGQRSSDNPDEAAHVAKLCMSLPHAKRLVRVLQGIIGSYERLFGDVTANAEDRLTPEQRALLGLAKTVDEDAS